MAEEAEVRVIPALPDLEEQAVVGLVVLLPERTEPLTLVVEVAEPMARILPVTVDLE